MEITLHDTGKRYNREWIFQHLSIELKPQTAYAITGPNGSGKSTLLQVIAGAVEPSAGSVEWKNNQSVIDPQNVYQHLAITAPYIEVIEEFTAREFLSFHAGFKPLTHAIDEILEWVQLLPSADKQIQYYSSGMKQRIKLAQAVFSNVPVLLLDEPCNNLDDAGIQLYHNLIRDFCSQKTIIVSSNDENEYRFCTQNIDIRHYKVKNKIMGL